MFTVTIRTRYNSTYPTVEQIIGEGLTRSQVTAAMESFGRVSGWTVGTRYRIGTDTYLHRGIIQRQFVTVTETES